jgi:aminodeoxyfutalosine deaminase
MADCGGISPVLRLHGYGLLNENFLAVHANYLRAQDIILLAESRANVVHCPRSHAYFGHRPFPRARLQAAGVNLCLGTDSLASVWRAPGQRPELSLFAEMRELFRTHQPLSAATILKMATLNGARALGMQGQLGELSPNALADLIAVPFTGSANKACAAVIESQKVCASLIDGHWAIPPVH